MLTICGNEVDSSAVRNHQPKTLFTHVSQLLTFQHSENEKKAEFLQTKSSSGRWNVSMMTSPRITNIESQADQHTASQSTFCANFVILVKRQQTGKMLQFNSLVREKKKRNESNDKNGRREKC